MKKIYAALFVAGLALTACGPSAKEQEKKEEMTKEAVENADAKMNEMLEETSTVDSMAQANAEMATQLAADSTAIDSTATDSTSAE